MHGPTTTILILDSDQDTASSGKINNWPEPGNNHGAAGLNMGFGDGHVEWVPRGPGLIETYLRSYNTAAMSDAFMAQQRPGLRTQTISFNGKSFRRWTYQ